jgi:hypothetical protein
MISSQPKLDKQIWERNPSQELLDHSNFATYNNSSAIELWTTKNTKMNQAITDWGNDTEICVEQLMMEDGEATSWGRARTQKIELLASDGGIATLPSSRLHHHVPRLHHSGWEKWRWEIRLRRWKKRQKKRETKVGGVNARFPSLY